MFRPKLVFLRDLQRESMTFRAGFDIPLIVSHIWSPCSLRCNEQNTTLGKSGLTESLNGKGNMLPHRCEIFNIAKHGSEMVISKKNVTSIEVRSDV